MDLWKKKRQVMAKNEVLSPGTHECYFYNHSCRVRCVFPLYNHLGLFLFKIFTYLFKCLQCP
ncbi:hypothetical protein GYMLUDRAFT_491964 [Collybiopsis luxurians FD-317 M1]|uniref:Uncharacterized protein n=1 Tax=Collybiopsis luxurians FD-317 M1 TaxID=944289 RepID=A0A0D0C3U9_9AGAR|nr:hypothetical protein GYMLUDRAFT_491964 [Collybiopsis luxurians FD-317 M1]